MSDYTISEIHSTEIQKIALIDNLLSKEGIKRDPNLDYICAMFDSDNHIIATGSCFFNTLRCFAVDSSHQGEGLLAEILSHLINIQFQRGHTHLFLYTKPNAASLFASLGFYEIARVNNSLVFMENRRNGFCDYLKHFNNISKDWLLAAVVINANPFTLGHQYLIESAAAKCDFLHVFVLSEDVSLIPFAIRKRLVTEGCAHLNNVYIHDSGPYIISNATFPSYFFKNEESVIESHALLDIAVFARIAATMNISVRYVGDEPNSIVTGIYNSLLSKKLPEFGITCHIVPRKKINNVAISASTVRLCLKNNDFKTLKDLVPLTTYNYFISDQAKSVIESIRSAENVIHY